MLASAFELSDLHLCLAVTQCRTSNVRFVRLVAEHGSSWNIGDRLVSASPRAALKDVLTGPKTAQVHSGNRFN